VNITQSNVLTEIYKVFRGRKLSENHREKTQTSYFERKVLTTMLLMVFVPETSVETLK